MADRIAEEKTALRAGIAGTAAALTEEYKKKASAAIAEAVLSSPAFRMARTVFLYRSTELEPDTRPILAAVWEAGKTALMPRCRNRPFMDAVPVLPGTEWRPGPFGIPEPMGEAFAPEEIDLAVVPCVAASPSGDRLGHGGGYYDAFLEKTGAYRLCLCFSALLSDRIPVGAHDLKMDAVVTENTVFSALPRG